jgi:AcrR family transcriptional regulator
MTQRQPTKRQRQAAATEQQLLVAAREVFEAKGYGATTVGAITAAASTAHGTFYLYFRNKEDAFAKVMGEVSDELLSQSQGRWAAGDPRASLEAQLRGFLTVFVQHRGLWRCLLEGSFTNPSIEAMWFQIRRSFVDRIAHNLRTLRDTGAIRDLHPELAANALGGMVEWAATTQFVLEAPPAAGASFDEAVETLTDLWFHAVYPPVGAQVVEVAQARV